MNIIGGFLVLTLIVLAAVHIHWAVGGHWPGKDAADAESRVVGTRRGRMPGPRAAAAVALALFAAAWTVEARHGLYRLGLPDWLWAGAYWTVFLVFLLRGVATYTPAFEYAKETPFYGLNRRFYGPLCLVIAAAMAWNGVV